MSRVIHECVKCGNQIQTTDLSWKDGSYVCSECGWPHFKIVEIRK